MQLVTELLNIRSANIEILVNDNRSDIDPNELFSEFSDERLRIVKNDVHLNASQNMIRTIYNSAGKYALYCNDRDMLIATKIDELATFLNTSDFSFVLTTQQRSHNRNRVKIYEAGYNSLINYSLSYHPTGCVYNCELIHKYLQERENGYTIGGRSAYSYSFLMRDLFLFNRTAVYDYGIWYPPSVSYSAENKSKFGKNGEAFFYFEPEYKIAMCLEILKQVFQQDDFGLNDQESKTVFIHILKRTINSIASYKSVLSNVYVTSHYGINRRFVFLSEMYRYFSDLYTQLNDFLQINPSFKNSLRALHSYKPAGMFRMLLASLKNDLGIIKRALCDHYPISTKQK